MYLCDVHTHTRISLDSSAPLPDMVWAAQRAGLNELCVTDHCDLLDGWGAPVACFDWPAALQQYHDAQKLAGDKLCLRLGLELGSAPANPEAARAILAGAGDELDFVLGSLHNWIGEQGNIDLFFTEYNGDPALCRRALENCLDNSWLLVTQHSDCYDSLAHLVYPLRYMRRDGMDLSMADYEERVRAIFTQIAQTGHALEVNTYRGQDLDSWPQLLAWFRACGGEFVTVGSDAHRPQDVAKGVRPALELLKAAGFGYVTTFSRRKPEPHKL